MLRTNLHSVSMNLVLMPLALGKEVKVMQHWASQKKKGDRWTVAVSKVRNSSSSKAGGDKKKKEKAKSKIILLPAAVYRVSHMIWALLLADNFYCVTHVCKIVCHNLTVQDFTSFIFGFYNFITYLQLINFNEEQFTFQTETHIISFRKESRISPYIY